jgi:hypothetical protein
MGGFVLAAGSSWSGAAHRQNAVQAWAP